MIACTFFICSSCKKSDDLVEIKKSTKNFQANVGFELNIGATSTSISKSFIPAYALDAFSIYAFKKSENSGDYIFNKTINLQNFTYSDSEKKIVGTDSIDAGIYKFLPIYGLRNQSNTLGSPAMEGRMLNQDLVMEYNANTPLKEIFLQTGEIEDIPEYEITVLSPNPRIKYTLNRAVARVDLMLIKAVKNPDGSYTEQSYPDGEDILGGNILEQIGFNFRSMNDRMNFFGRNLTGTPISANLNLENPDQLVVVGTGTKTIIGSNTYDKYDHIESDDIIKGSAHIFGTYMIPNNDGSRTTGMDVYLKPVNGVGRRFNVSTLDNNHLLPLERNKITLVKVYVLEGNVFTPNVRFEVEVNIVWETPNKEEGEINDISI
ncbi:MAG: hypothetical protein LBQ60_09840 [Bacteroidales bacterium]|jgi:hypothetical protein|nr:hypothetical protein [Bacteroidales bacterium]